MSVLLLVETLDEVGMGTVVFLPTTLLSCFCFTLLLPCYFCLHQLCLC